MFFFIQSICSTYYFQMLLRLKSHLFLGFNGSIVHCFDELLEEHGVLLQLVRPRFQLKRFQFEKNVMFSHIHLLIFFFQTYSKLVLVHTVMVTTKILVPLKVCALFLHQFKVFLNSKRKLLKVELILQNFIK